MVVNRNSPAYMNGVILKQKNKQSRIRMFLKLLVVMAMFQDYKDKKSRLMKHDFSIC